MTETPRLGVPRAVWSYAIESNVPDKGRAFALAFILGCSSSSVALRWIALGMQRADPALLPTFAEALALASNPDIDNIAMTPIAAPWMRARSAPRVR